MQKWFHIMTTDFSDEHEQVSIPYLITTAHGNARSKGWWDKPRTPMELLMLVVTEIAEAAEELRTLSDTLGMSTIYYASDNPQKPLGFPIEIADAVIRIFDLCGGLHIDLSAALIAKMNYNKTRSYKHGNKNL